MLCARGPHVPVLGGGAAPAAEPSPPPPPRSPPLHPFHIRTLVPACDVQIARASAESLKELLGDVIPLVSVLNFAAQKIKPISDLPRLIKVVKESEEVTPPTPRRRRPAAPRQRSHTTSFLRWAQAKLELLKKLTEEQLYQAHHAPAARGLRGTHTHAHARTCGRAGFGEGGGRSKWGRLGARARTQRSHAYCTCASLVASRRRRGVGSVARASPVGIACRAQSVFGQDVDNSANAQDVRGNSYARRKAVRAARTAWVKANHDHPDDLMEVAKVRRRRAPTRARRPCCVPVADAHVTARQRALNGEWETNQIFANAFADAGVLVTEGDKVRHAPAGASLACARRPRAM